MIAVVFIAQINKNMKPKNQKITAKIEGWNIEYSIPERKLTKEDFENVELGCSEEDIIDMFGEPDLWIGSGIIKPGYVLENGDVIVLYFGNVFNCEDLETIRIYFRNGDEQILKTNIFTDDNGISDMVEYLENILEIEFGEYVCNANGEIRYGDTEEQVAIKIEVKKEHEDTLLERFDEKLMRYDSDPYYIPGYQEHEYTKEMQEQEFKCMYSFFCDGKKAKTRNIIIYVTVKNNMMCMYFFG